MSKNITNQKGLTLVELLATMVLTAIVSLLLFSIATKALENTNIIGQETVLRDEADIIVSKFIKTLYSTRQDHIIRNITTTDGNSYIEVTNDLSKCRRDENGKFLDKDGNPLNNDSYCRPTLQPIGFKTTNGTTKIHILNEEYAIINKGIKILPTSKINGNPEETTVYEIMLNLASTTKRGNNTVTKEMTFKNEVQPIVISK
ncbi:PulJ/GspJ family protein [Solibacillus silvestris]|uniref:PulJ/GspJ family protein n=1 Tax=Solibacillus silvestris TaxID=76853 RepID=UPI003F8153C3